VTLSFSSNQIIHFVFALTIVHMKVTFDDMTSRNALHQNSLFELQQLDDKSPLHSTYSLHIIPKRKKENNSLSL
jgi:hypothetical protein